MLLLPLFFIFDFDDFVAVVVCDKTASIGWYQTLHIPSFIIMIIINIILSVILNVPSFSSDKSLMIPCSCYCYQLPSDGTIAATGTIIGSQMIHCKSSSYGTNLDITDTAFYVVFSNESIFLSHLLLIYCCCLWWWWRLIFVINCKPIIANHIVVLLLFSYLLITYVPCTIMGTKENWGPKWPGTKENEEKKKKTRQENKTYYLFRYGLWYCTLYVIMSILVLNKKNFVFFIDVPALINRY